MFIFLALLLSVAAMLAVAYPVVAHMREDGAPAAAPAEDTLQELMAQRDAAFGALRDLNFDHQVGKITDEDFVVFEANLKQTAAAALAALDRWEAQADGELDLEMEQEIAARRAALATPGQTCPHCGRLSAAGDAFCSGCGRPLAQPPTPVAAGKPVCPHCGRACEPGDRFCPGCGQAMGVRMAAAQH